MKLNEKTAAIINEGMNALASRIPTGPKTRLLVFNSLPWKRTSVAQIKRAKENPLTVIDDVTGQKVPSEVFSLGEEEFLRFEARDVPSIGYKTYSLSAGVKGTGNVKVNGNVIENRHYRIEVDPSAGGLRSIFDKQRNIELVDSKSHYKANQYLYLSEEREYTPSSVTVSPGPAGPVSGSLIIEASTLRSKIKTTLTLYLNIDRIYITNEVTKTPSSEPTQIYFVFPFDVPNRVYHYEATGAIIKSNMAANNSTVQAKPVTRAGHSSTFPMISMESHWA